VRRAVSVVPVLILAAGALALVPACKKKGGTDAVVTASSGSCDRGGDPYGPVKLSEAQADNRHGIGQRRLDLVQTTKARPVEVCGVKGQLTWLVYATCADGSHPFQDGRTAHAARRGNVGAGGQCDSIIDLYEVPCPEKTYEVYMDLYMCGPGESVR